MSKYESLVFIGRFQPVHQGHLSVIMDGLKLLKEQGEIVVAVGSTNAARSIRNPFTFKERSHLIAESLREMHSGERSVCVSTGETTINFKGNKRVRITDLPDNPYNLNLWIKSVQEKVKSSSTALIGHDKDTTSSYLNLFPQWDVHDMGNSGMFNATDIRKSFFDHGNYYYKSFPVSPTVRSFLKEFENSDHYHRLVEEMEEVAGIHDSWKHSPYPPQFITCDAVIVQAGHVCLIKRKDAPGKGLGALPGGYVNSDETVFEGMVREAYEESKPNIPKGVFRERVRGAHVYDDPHRDVRGRFVTHAFYLNLDHEVSRSKKPQLTKLKAGDDAEKASWIPLSELDPTRMYSDHYHIVQDMIRRFGGDV